MGFTTDTTIQRDYIMFDLHLSGVDFDSLIAQQITLVALADDLEANLHDNSGQVAILDATITLLDDAMASIMKRTHLLDRLNK